MRILIADRNRLLLESIARSFAGQFPIESATSHEQCNGLLRQGQFDLVVISEKLADGPGLQLLAQIARNSPDTLRVFAARRSRLELLKGKLGPFGLFRTLSYPINPRELHSLLTLSRSGLETEMPAIAVPTAKAVAIPEKVAAPPIKLPAPAKPPELAKPPEPAKPVAVPVVARPSAERISMFRASALFSADVFESITGQPAPREMRPSRPVESRPVQSQSRDKAPEVVQPRPAAVPPPPVVHQPAMHQPAMHQPAMRQQATRQQAMHQQAMHQQAIRQQAMREEEMAPADFWQVIPLPPAPSLMRRSPLRTKLVLGATVVAVFVVTALTMNLMDAGVHVSHASAPDSMVETEQPPAVSEAPPVAAPVELTPAPTHPARETQHSAPKPDTTEPKVASADSRVAASTTPIADPSSFGSEAYEVVYTN